MFLSRNNDLVTQKIKVYKLLRAALCRNYFLSSIYIRQAKEECSYLIIQLSRGATPLMFHVLSRCQ